MSGVRFLSFNIHGGRNRAGQRDLNAIHTLLEHFDIDVAVFQEVETRASRGGMPDDIDMLAGSSRPYRFIGASKREGAGWYGNLIASRYPLSNGHAHNLETRPVFEPRNAVDVLVSTATGNIRVVGTHLSLFTFPYCRHTRDIFRR